MKPTHGPPIHTPRWQREGRRPVPHALAHLVLRTGLHERFTKEYERKLKKKLRRKRQWVDRLHQQVKDLLAAGNGKKAARVQGDIDRLDDMDKALYQFRNFKDLQGEPIFETTGEEFGAPPPETSQYRFGIRDDQGNVVWGDK